MVALPAQQNTGNSGQENAQKEPGLQGITYYGRFKSLAIPSSFDPQDSAAIKQYFLNFLNSLIQSELSNGTKVPFSYSYNGSAASELKNLTFKIEDKSLDRSEQAFTTDSNVLYPSDLVNILNGMYAYVNNTYFQNKKTLNSFPVPGGEDDLFSSVRSFWVENPNNPQLGFHERDFYNETRVRIRERLFELRSLVLEINAGDLGSEANQDSVFENLRNLDGSSLISHAQTVIIPVLEATKKSSGRETISIALSIWGGDLKSFNWGGPGGNTIKAYLNEFARTFVNSLVAGNPRNETLAKLRAKLTDPLFLRHTRNISDLIDELVKLDLGGVNFIKIITDPSGLTNNKVVSLSRVQDNSYIFPNPESEQVTNQDTNTAENLLRAIRILISLADQDFTPTRTQQDSGEDTDGGAEETEDPDNEQERSQLLSTNQLLKKALEITQKNAEKIWQELSPEELVNSLLSYPQNKQVDTTQLWSWMSNQLQATVSRNFESSWLVNEIKLVDFTNQLDERFIENLQISKSFYDPETRMFVVNPAKADSDYSLWLAAIIEAVAEPSARTIFLKTEELFYDFKSLQLTPEEIAEEAGAASIQEQITANVPTNEKLQELIERYNRANPNLSVPTASTTQDLIALQSSNPQKFLSFAYGTGSLRLIDDELRNLVLIQLEKHGVILSMEEQNRLFNSIKQDFNDYLLSLSPDQVITALSDSTAKRILFAEFNRRFLLNQLNSSRLVQDYSVYKLTEQNEKVTKEIDDLIATSSIQSPDEFKEKIRALLIVSGYQPDSTELESLSQDQLELLFNTRFGRNLSDKELLAYKRAIHAYASQFFYEQKFEEQATVLEELDKKRKIDNSFEEERKASLDRIISNTQTFFPGALISQANLEKNIQAFLKENRYNGVISVTDAAYLLGIPANELLSQEQSKLLFDLLREYIEQFGTARNLQRKLLSPRKNLVVGGLAASPLSQNLQQHGELLGEIAPNLPEGIISGNKKEWSFSDKIELYLTFEEYQKLLKQYQEQSNEKLPSVHEWGVPINPNQQAAVEEEIAELQNRIRLIDAEQSQSSQQLQLPTPKDITYENIGSPIAQDKSKKKKFKNFLNKLKERKEKTRKKRKFPGQRRLEKMMNRQAVKAIVSAITKLAALLVQLATLLTNLAIMAITGLASLFGLLFAMGPIGWLIAGATTIVGGIAFWPAIKGFFDSIGSFLEKAWGWLTGGGGSVTTTIGTGVIIVGSGLATIEVIDNARFSLPTESAAVDEISEYIDMTKTASPATLENGEVADITYTITLTAKDNYIITPNIDSVNDTFTTSGSSVSGDPQAPAQQLLVQQLREQLANQTIDSNPLVLSYIIPGISGEDAFINNTFEMSFSVSIPGSPDTTLEDSFKARARVKIGNPQGSICWPVTGRISQMPYQESTDSIPEPSHSSVRSSDGKLVGADAFDIAAPVGEPIYAPFDGIVENQMPNTGGKSYGAAFGPYHILLRSDQNQIVYAFAHNSAMSVRPGDTVSRGQIIGYVGNLGMSSGPHLHFEKTFQGKLLGLLDKDDLTLNLEVPLDESGSPAKLYSIVRSDCN